MLCGDPQVQVHPTKECMKNTRPLDENANHVAFLLRTTSAVANPTVPRIKSPILSTALKALHGLNLPPLQPWSAARWTPATLIGPQCLGPIKLLPPQKNFISTTLSTCTPLPLPPGPAKSHLPISLTLNVTLSRKPFLTPFGTSNSPSLPLSHLQLINHLVNYVIDVYVHCTFHEDRDHSCLTPVSLAFRAHRWN